MHLGPVEKKSHRTGMYKPCQAVLRFDYCSGQYVFLLFGASVTCIYGPVPLQLKLSIRVPPASGSSGSGSSAGAGGTADTTAPTTGTGTGREREREREGNTMISAVTDPAPVKQGREFAITYRTPTPTTPPTTSSSSTVIQVTVLRCTESSQRLLWTSYITHILTKL